MSWYQLVVFIHIIGAIGWVGGILFLRFVAVPAIRRLGAEERTQLLEDIGRRFRTFGYGLLVLLALTGVVQAAAYGATWQNLLDGSFFQTRFGVRLGMKLFFIALMLIASISHDFFVGPASVRAARTGNVAEQERLRKIASWLARLTAVFALLVIYYAMRLVR